MDQTFHEALFPSKGNGGPNNANVITKDKRFQDECLLRIEKQKHGQHQSREVSEFKSI